ncbi:MAG: metallophosphoesterase [Actinobacteria bacterium]|nr:metallophosphoesterase [Actinomycetota bacterium]
MRAGSTGTRLLFATDIHGSDACFRKFVNAHTVYRTPLLILGGDITGKMIVPILRERDGTYSCEYNDRHYTELDEAGKTELMTVIRRFGHYPLVGGEDEIVALADPGHRDAAFRRTVYASIEDWVTFAEERLRGTGVQLFMAPGNDDFLEIDSALQGSDVVTFAEGRCLPIGDVYEMITTGYSNPTPWNTDRELPEDKLRERLDSMFSQVKNPENLICVAHPPPYDSSLDSAPALDEEFGMQVEMGVGVVTAPVGSTAVRGFIEEAAPLLSLHGHVHEGGGAVEIGRTLCVNPGSAYTGGTLMSAIIELQDGAVKSHQFAAA